jgi:alpha-tubulin suppressor-like RCC1 family protein
MQSYSCCLPSPAAFAAGTPSCNCCSWGSAANGRLGTGRFEETSYPEMLPELDGEQILELACGLDHTLALVRDL